MANETTSSQTVGAGNPKAIIGSVGAPQAASTIRLVSSERAMKPYTIFDTEIKTLARASGLSSLFFSMTAAIASYIFRIYAEPTTDSKSLMGLAILAFMCGAIGLWANSWRNEIIDLIKKESGDLNETRRFFGVRIFSRK